MAISMTEFLHGTWTGRAAILADLDGCLIAGERVLPHVPALLAACGPRLWIVSNNSTDTAAGLSLRLAGMGLDVAPNRILLAGEETLRALALERPGARVALFATPALHGLAHALGLVTVTDRADVVVLARDTGFGFVDLARLAALVQRGAPLWLTNPDPGHPGPDGLSVPETGALFAALRAMVPQVAPRCIGKPAPDLICKALARAAVVPGASVYLGDTQQTDGAAAAAAGVEFVQITPPMAAPARTGVLSC